MGEMTIDRFGEVIDNFLKENEVQMLITLPEDSLDAEVKDNTGMGSVIQFYIFLHAFPAIFKLMEEQVGGFDRKEDLVDAILRILKDEVMDELQEEDDQP